MTNCSPSLLDLHLKLLDDPGDRDNPEWARVEAQRAIPVEPLRLLNRTQRSRKILWLTGIAALAASIAVVSYVSPKNDVSFKGKAKVFVMTQDKDGIAIWDGSSPLAAGTKVNTEILPIQDSVAFVAIYDRANHLISPEESIAKSQLTLTAGNRDHFKNAFELTQENDGEQLVTIVCDKALFEQKTTENLQTLIQLMKSKPSTESLNQSLPFCGIEQFTLRK